MRLIGGPLDGEVHEIGDTQEVAEFAERPELDMPRLIGDPEAMPNDMVCTKHTYRRDGRFMRYQEVQK